MLPPPASCCALIPTLSQYAHIQRSAASMVQSLHNVLRMPPCGFPIPDRRWTVALAPHSHLQHCPTENHLAGSTTLPPWDRISLAREGVSSGRSATLRPPLSCTPQMHFDYIPARLTRSLKAKQHQHTSMRMMSTCLHPAGLPLLMADM